MARWAQTVRLGDVWNDDDRDWAETRDAIVPRLRRLKDNEMGDLGEIIDELSEVECVEDFDQVWSGLYDYADEHRIWIDVFRGPGE